MKPTTKPLSVLVVHPDADVAQEIASSVRAAGHTPTIVPSGERAIDEFVQAPADVLIVDLFLPGRDGQLTIESIRWAPHGEQAAVILTGTRSSQRELDAAARKVGALATFINEFPEDTFSLVLGRIAQRVHGRTTAPPRGSAMAQPYAAKANESAIRESLLVDNNVTEITAPGFHGNLAETPFAKVLTLLAEQRAHGALSVRAEQDARITITGGQAKKIVFFYNGTPVSVHSNLFEECLGQILIDRFDFSEEVLSDALLRVRSGQGRLGAVLLARAVITPKELREALETQQRTKLFDIFSWEEGSYRFAERVSPPVEAVSLDLPLSQIMYQGLSQHMSRTRVTELLLANKGFYVVPDPRQLVTFLRASLQNAEREWVLSLDGTRRIEELVSSPGRPDRAAAILLAMIYLSSVHLEPKPRPVQWDARALPTELVTLRDGAELRAQLLELGRLLRAGEYRKALRVSGDNERTTVEIIERLDARLRLLTEAGSSSRELRTLAYEVRARLSQVRLSMRSDASFNGQTPTRESVAPPANDDSPEAEATETKRDPLPPIPAKTDLDARVIQMFQAERHFRKGERALRKERYLEAISAIEQAMEIAPDEGEFLVYLGYARYYSSSSPETQRRALEELHRGAELAPKLDVAHLFRGKIFEERGEIIEAKNAYQSALAVNPNCTEAYDRLRGLDSA